MEGSWPAIALDTKMPQLFRFYGQIYVRSIEHVVIYGLRKFAELQFLIFSPNTFAGSRQNEREKISEIYDFS